MAKKRVGKGTLLNPLPVVMVSCGQEKPNIITVAWTGIVNSEPPMTYVSVRKSRYSHEILSQEKEFVINLVTKDLVADTDFCGVRSGRDMDKFAQRGLHPQKVEGVACPGILESPMQLACKVVEIKEWPSHDMFIAEIVGVEAEETLFDEKGRLEMDRLGLVAYCHGEYIPLKREPVGGFGFSVMKPKTRRRRKAQGQRVYPRKK